MNKKMIKSAGVLTVGTIVAKFLGAVYRIPLSNILGTEGIGVYQMVFPLYSLLLVFLTGGVCTYSSQKVASLRAVGNFEGIEVFFRSIKNICVVYGIVVASFLAGLSFQISTLQGNDLATLGYIAIALSFVFSCILGAYRGYFQGFENMFPTAISQIIEQTFKLVFGLLFSLLLIKNGVMWGVFGALLGVSVSEIFSYVFMLVYGKSKKYKVTLKNQTQNPKHIVLSFLPISLTSIMLPLINAFDSFFVIKLMTLSGLDTKVSTSLFGIYSGMVNPILNFPILVSLALCTSLLPNVSYKIKNGDDVRNDISNAFMFVWMFSLPCAGGLIATAPYVLKILFPSIEAELFGVAVLSMRISCINVVWLSLIALCSSVLQSYGYYKKPCLGLGIAFLLKIVLTFIISLNPNINIIGLSVINTFVYSLGVIINLYQVKKYADFKLNIKQSLFPFIFSIFMTILILVIKNYLFFSIFINTALLVIIGVSLYFSLFFIFKLISIKQIKNMIKNK